MPRLPVTHTAWLVLMVAAAMLLPLADYAQAVLPQTQHRLITNISQLEGDKQVRYYRELYPALSASNLIYAKCSHEFNISETQQGYLSQKFDSVSKGYIRAYEDAYVTSTGSLPPQSFLDDVAAALVKRQQAAVDNVAKAISQRGCKDGRLRLFVKYVDSLHKQDRDLQNHKPAAPAVPYQ